ncbi:MAG TPA: winged helix-turn-helix domain-containing protein [Thermoanaerobaculia bacterium]|nr:winged helix-turn-helix domain-containing protein [Thermoanaerobaculia bacterium]
MSLPADVVPACGDFMLGDRRVRPSRNLVELPAGMASSHPEAAAGIAEPGRPESAGTASLPPAGAEAAAYGQPLNAGTASSLPPGVQVEPKVMEVLVCLARHAGRVVSKDELVREVWEGRFVSDDVVWRSVRELRRALGDEARAPRFIETIPKRGYRLLAPVAEIAEREGIAAAREEMRLAREWTAVAREGEAAREEEPAQPRVPARRPMRQAAAVALALLAALALAAAWRLGARRPAGLAPVRIAVLPFANLSGDAGQAYFADGLTEELISRLGSLRPGRLAVVGRTSVMALAGRGGDAAEIGRKLGATYLLEGGVRRDGERARVTVRLVRAADGTAIWSQRQDVELRQTLQAESAIAERVARELAIELLPSRPAAPRPAPAAAAAADPVAHDLELRGRYLLARATSAAALAEAAAQFRAAADLDPAAATPRSGLADCYHLMAVVGLLPPADAYPRAEAAALAAVERDPDSVEGRTVLGSIRFRYRWDYGAAERDFRRALAANPSYAPAHHDYAWLLVALGRMDEGIAEIREAQRLEPLSLRASADVGWVLYRAGRPDEAVAAMSRLLAQQPGFTAARDCLERALARRGRDAEALAVAREALRREGASPAEIAALVAGPAGAGAADPAAARRRIAAWRLARLTASAAGGAYVSPYAVAAFELDAGNPDAAFAALERAVAGHDPMVVMMAVDPELAPLRADRRFAALLHRLGLPPARG